EQLPFYSIIAIFIPTKRISQCRVAYEVGLTSCQFFEVRQKQLAVSSPLSYPLHSALQTPHKCDGLLYRRIRAAARHLPTQILPLPPKTPLPCNNLNNLGGFSL